MAIPGYSFNTIREPVKPKLPTQSAPTPTMAQQPTTITRTASAPSAPVGMKPGGSTVTRTAAQQPAGFTDLRSQVFRPTMSTATQQAQGMTSGLAGRLSSYNFPSFQPMGQANYGQAQGLYGDARGAIPGMGSIRGFQGIGAGSYDPSGDTMQTRNMVLEALKGLQGPDRGAIAGSVFDQLVERSRPQYEYDLRAVGRKGAALGRVGSDMLSSELMDVHTSRERDLSLARQGLASEAAAATLADRLGILGGTQGVFGQFGGEDRANAGFQLDLRNEARGERGAGLDYDFNRANLGLARSQALAGLGDRSADLASQGWQQRFADRNAGLDYGLNQFNAQHGLLNTLGGLEQQRFGQDVTGRNEMRAERDFQTGLAQQGIQNALQQRLSEEQIYGNDYNRWLNTVQTFGGMGYGGDPSGAMLAGAGQYGQQAQAGMQGLGDMAMNWSYMDWARRNGMA